MRHTISKTLLMALAAICMTACMDFEPKAQMGDNLVWGSADNFQLFANQYYGYLRDLSNTSGYQAVLSDGPHSDYRSDIVCAANRNSYADGYNTVEASDGYYGSLYNRIYKTNLLLRNAEDFSNQKSIATPMGEAYFFRAYLYFELLQIYGDAIILTEPIDMNDSKLYAERNPRTEVADLILADLDRAAQLLPEKPMEAGRVAKDAAYAMASRVALFEGTWEKFHPNFASGDLTENPDVMENTERVKSLLSRAKRDAQMVMQRANYSLFYNATLGDESYRYMFILEDETCNPAGLTKSANTEYILSKRHRSGDKIGVNVTKAYLANACYPTSKLMDMYLCIDGLPISQSTLFQGYSGAASEFVNRDGRMQNTFLKHDQAYWNNDSKYRTKWDDTDPSLTCNARSNSGYQTHKWGVERKVENYYESMDFPVIRYAEVLLNYAEATYEYNHSISDADLNKSLNLVRERSNKANIKKMALTNAQGLNLREEIRRERTVEFALEGYRIDDLKRWGMTVKEMNMDQLGVHFTGTWFESNWSAQRRELKNGQILLYGGKTWTTRNILYPLPNDQRQLNTNLSQNPGW